jgi:hypothetical protein
MILFINLIFGDIQQTPCIVPLIKYELFEVPSEEVIDEPVIIYSHHILFIFHHYQFTVYELKIKLPFKAFYCLVINHQIREICLKNFVNPNFRSDVLRFGLHISI